MALHKRLQSSRVRRGLAASVVALAACGLVLARAPSTAQHLTTAAAEPGGGVAFSGPALSGSFALSHSTVTAGAGRLFGEIRLRADKAGQVERAPLALAIVLDTSGSMQGDKINQAKRSVTKLVGQMRDDDQVAVVHYSSSHQVIQPLARVGTVREALLAQIRHLEANGGTNIPPALKAGVDEVERSSLDRVRRVVLVSDGLDNGSRQNAVRLAKDSAGRSATISTLGIGLDFDEAYMSAVASSGRGNFGFVKDAAALARFLNKELEETANTRVRSVKVRLDLPKGIRLVQATGAETRVTDDGIEILAGGLFAGDERRIALEFRSLAEAGQELSITGDVDWTVVGGDQARAKVAGLSVVGAPAGTPVKRNAAVYASCMSAFASLRQLAATDAYRSGDKQKAFALMAQNDGELEAAAADAPPSVKEALDRQRRAYRATKGKFRAAPGTAAGRAAAKAATELDAKNADRAAF